MTVVVGTAGHIDHGKTSLLRALTGMDADRLPEERRRGMTIDVGYAHMKLADGADLDFVDVPGHDRLIGNMLVGAGEIDAAMLVVAADDGPRAQTLEHLGLLDALGIGPGLAVVTKSDVVPAMRVEEVREAVRALLASTSLAGSPVVAASSVTGAGLDDVHREVDDVARRVRARPGPTRLAIDRVFTVRGRGVVVTGTLRGGSVGRGDVLRVEPLGGEVRVREVQVHNQPHERTAGGGRVALNVAGPRAADLSRGMVLTAGPGVERSERPLIAVRIARAADQILRHGMRVRVHSATAVADGTLDLGRRASVAGPDGSLTAIVRLDGPIATAFGDPFVLRRPSPAGTLAGATVLDPKPPRGVSRRRMDPVAMRRFLEGVPGSGAHLAALVQVHGVLPGARVDAWRAIRGDERMAGPFAGAGGAHARLVAADVEGRLSTAARDAASADGATVAQVRTAVRGALRRIATVDDAEAAAIAGETIDRLVAGGSIVRDHDRLLPQGSSTGFRPDLEAAMDRLVALLDVPAPPALSAATTAAGCPPDGLRALEADQRIMRVEDDLAWAADTYRRLEGMATQMAAAGPLTPAAFRDATGTSRRYALAILEDLDRRGVLRRTPAGHVPGPHAATGAAR